MILCWLFDKCKCADTGCLELTGVIDMWWILISVLVYKRRRGWGGRGLCALTECDSLKFQTWFCNKWGWMGAWIWMRWPWACWHVGSSGQGSIAAGASEMQTFIFIVGVDKSCCWRRVTSKKHTRHSVIIFRKWNQPFLYFLKGISRARVSPNMSTTNAKVKLCCLHHVGDDFKLWGRKKKRFLHAPR